jgi:hypothetical protein
MSTGKVAEPRSSFDNYNIFLDEDIDVMRKDVKPYVVKTRYNRDTVIENTETTNEFDNILETFENTAVQEVRYEMTGNDDDPDVIFESDNVKLEMSPD